MFAKIDKSKFPLVIIDYDKSCLKNDDFIDYLNEIELIFDKKKKFILVHNFLEIKFFNPLFFFKTLKFLSGQNLDLVKSVYFVTQNKLASSAVKYSPVKRFHLRKYRKDAIKDAKKEFLPITKIF